jgi:hypothetical protein
MFKVLGSVNPQYHKREREGRKERREGGRRKEGREEGKKSN